jgi:hypothetical protein
VHCIEINPAGLSAFNESLERFPEAERRRMSFEVGPAGGASDAVLRAADVIIVDPPRKGLEPELLRRLAAPEWGHGVAVSAGGRGAFKFLPLTQAGLEENRDAQCEAAGFGFRTAANGNIEVDKIGSGQAGDAEGGVDTTGVLLEGVSIGFEGGAHLDDTNKVDCEDFGHSLADQDGRERCDVETESSIDALSEPRWDARGVGESNEGMRLVCGTNEMSCAEVEDEGRQVLMYLSCGLPALLRDAEVLLSSGRWDLVHVKAYVFFPGADAIETLAVFQRR